MRLTPEHEPDERGF